MKDELKDHIKEKIRQIRTKSGLSQKDFADLVGVSQNTMNRLENGHRSPDMDFLATIRQRFEADINELVDPQYDQHARATSMDRIPVYDDLQLSLPETQRRVASYMMCPDAKGADYFYRIKNNVMAPEIKTGDLVGVVSGPVSLGDLVLIRNSSGIIEARRMGSLATGNILVADNQDYTPISDVSSQTLLGRIGIVIKVQQY